MSSKCVTEMCQQDVSSKIDAFWKIGKLCRSSFRCCNLYKWLRQVFKMILFSDWSSIRPIIIDVLSEGSWRHQVSNLKTFIRKCSKLGSPDNRTFWGRIAKYTWLHFTWTGTGFVTRSPDRPLSVSRDTGLTNRTKLYKTYKRWWKSFGLFRDTFDSDFGRL